MATNLRVPDGKKVSITQENPQGGEVMSFRPKTVLALKSVSGVPVRRPVRLGDINSFERLANKEALNGLIPLLPDREGKIGGVHYDLVQAVVANLDEKAPIPKQVRLVQRPRSRDDLRPARSAFNLPYRVPVPDRDWLKQIGWERKVFEFLSPDWMRELRVFISSLMFGDIEVGSNSTLVIGPQISGLFAGNVRLHQGARIVQQSSYLTAEITGDLQGDLP